MIALLLNFARNFCKIKLCAGKVNFSELELQQLQAIIGKDKVKARALQNMVESQLQYLPTGAGDYQGSALQRFFKSVTKM